MANISVDVRVPTLAEQYRIDDLMRGLTARAPGARLTVVGGRRRPPMTPESSAELFALASRITSELGQEPLSGAAVGGASDGNSTRPRAARRWTAWAPSAAEPTRTPSTWTSPG
ncbi:hypothetical protein [Streptomyces soliscabiei]|uniref:hypothetical protein n=1 Tax=Streptomyces soliscabiei TaxID=588897 RepID=UPI0029AA94D0|nr:hypothetical protein [Streptomyces sp. NY05-11A]MDX2678210.1 hypothetical protein [Streptomyces sp. NY05-11A]